MPLLAAEAAKLSEADLQAGIITEIIDRDEMFAMLPFTQVNGKSYDYNRENTLAGADFLDPNETVNESASTFTEVTTRLRILAGDLDIDNFLRETQSDLNDQLAIQVAQKAKGIRRIFQQTLATAGGTGSTKRFEGLPDYIANDGSMEVFFQSGGSNVSANITLEALDMLKDSVKAGADAFVMRPGTWLAVKSLIRALGGTMPDHVMIENFGRMPAIDGTPVLINEWLANDEVGPDAETDTCSVYAVRFNEVDGFHGLYGGASAGLRLEEVGTVQNKDAIRWRMKWYCGTALKSTTSLRRLPGVLNI